MSRFAPFVTLLVLLAPIAAMGSVGAAGATNDEVGLTVVVVDDLGAEVGGAAVTVSTENGDVTARTAPNGQAVFAVPNGSSVEIDVEHEQLVINQPRTIERVEGHSEAEVTMYPEADASLRVVDVDDDIDGASLSVRKVGQSEPIAAGETSADGEFAIDGVEEGTYEVSVEKSGYYDRTTEVEVTDGARELIELESGTVEVAVTAFGIDEESDDRQQIPAEITIERGGDHVATFSTDGDGPATTRLAVNTQYRIVAESGGYDTASRVTKTDEDDRSYDLELDRVPTLTIDVDETRVDAGDAVTVTVADGFGEPVADADVLVDGAVVGTTDDAGQATVTIDSAGEVDLAAADEGIDSDPIVLEVVDQSGDGTDGGSDDGGGTSGDDGDGDADETGESGESDASGDDGEDGAESEDGTDRAVEDNSLPGFTPISALAALAAAFAVALVRRR